MALNTQDFIPGLDFTGYVEQTASMHNNLVQAGMPFTDKGLVAVTTDSALDTPDVPDAATTTKWRNYLWLRRPHSTATDTTPIAYVWNDNASSDATYLKWERLEQDTSALENQLAALELRVEDLEAAIDAVTATANAANANAANAVTTANAAQTTANTANANATQALSDLNTPTTGVKDRLTAVENRLTTAESNIAAIQVSIANINNTLNSGLGPTFISPHLVVTTPAGGSVAWATNSGIVPVDAKAVILQIENSGGVVGTGLKTYEVRRNASGPSYTALVTEAQNTVMAICPVDNGTFQYQITDANPIAGRVGVIRIIGYYL